MKKFILIFTTLILIGITSCKNSENNAKQSDIQDVDSKNITTLNIEVSGMTCTGCEQTIVKTLEKNPAVISAEASHTEGIAKVSYDNSVLNKDSIAAIITETGYQVEGYITEN